MTDRHAMVYSMPYQVVVVSWNSIPYHTTQIPQWCRPLEVMHYESGRTVGRRLTSHMIVPEGVITK
jgi:hypothetical protein